jgi:tetratricopeptide (TPR) repeat protein
MRNIFLFILLGIVGTTKLSAQGKELDKLIFLYIDENYEKCVSKGISMTESDEYRKEPLPYLYVSMSYYEIARNEEFDEKYPKAFKESMKFAYKYRKKDKNLEYAGKYRDFFLILKDSANQLADLYYKTEDFRKAAYIYKQVVRFDPDAYVMQILQGIAEIKSRNIGEGERNLTLAMENIDDNYAPDKIERSVAYWAFTEYANYMDSKGDYAETKRGKRLAEKFKEYDPKVIKEKEAEETKKEEPVKEVKKFETSEDAVKNQKTRIVGSENSKVEDAKEEMKKIAEEEKQQQQPPTPPAKKVKTFSSDQ